MLPVESKETYKTQQDTLLEPSKLLYLKIFKRKFASIQSFLFYFFGVEIKEILERIAIPPTKGRFYVKNSLFQSKSNENTLVWEIFSETVNLVDVKAHFVQVSGIFTFFILKTKLHLEGHVRNYFLFNLVINQNWFL